MRFLAATLLVSLLAAPLASAHGALTINAFDTYAISDFEGQEESFAWEGFEIWDVYAGDGYNVGLASHGVYFKANFAGDGSIRPAQGETWEIRFTFTLGGESYEREIVHDGADVSTDFEQLEWQIADGNVFQIHAWVPVDVQEGEISDLVVVSSVDGQPRDTAPGGIHDPATGQEVPVEAPPTTVFPAMGEGRIVDTVPLTGAAKFLNVTLEDQGDGRFGFVVTNPLPAQGQHFMFRSVDQAGWSLEGAPNAASVEGGASLEFTLALSPEANATQVRPVQLDLLTDIGGLASYYAFLGPEGVEITDDPSRALTTSIEEPTVDTPALPAVALLLALVFAVRRRR